MAYRFSRYTANAFASDSPNRRPAGERASIGPHGQQHIELIENWNLTDRNMMSVSAAALR
jgi:hypothetical protein